jgi:hypothetical protein
MSSHIFFCNETDCSNMTTYYGATCYDCCEAKWTREPVQMCEPAHCPGCDRELWAVLLGTSGYCGPCFFRWNSRLRSYSECCQDISIQGFILRSIISQSVIFNTSFKTSAGFSFSLWNHFFKKMQ